MKTPRFWIGMGLSLVALVWILRGIRLADVWTGLQGVNYLFFVPSLILVLVGMWGRAMRRRLLFSPTSCLSLFLSRMACLKKNDDLCRGADSLLEGLSALHSPRLGLEIVSWSFLVWLCAALLPYVMLLAFGLHLFFAASLFVVCVIWLGFSVPSSPGYAGLYHSLEVRALTVYSLEKSLAFSYVLMIHGWQDILLSFWAFSLWKESLSYDEPGLR
jgi:uncharacterized membrane protein YbhN (UPF0104 family)